MGQGRGADWVGFLKGGEGSRVVTGADLLENSDPSRVSQSLGDSRKLAVCQSSILRCGHNKRVSLTERPPPAPPLQARRFLGCLEEGVGSVHQQADVRKVVHGAKEHKQRTRDAPTYGGTHQHLAIPLHKAGRQQQGPERGQAPQQTQKARFRP